MKNLLVILFFIQLSNLTSQAQWFTQQSGVTNHLYDMEFILSAGTALIPHRFIFPDQQTAEVTGLIILSAIINFYRRAYQERVQEIKVII